MKGILFFVSILIVTFIPGFIQGQSIRQVVELALENNSTIKAVYEEYNSASANTKAAFLHTLPRLYMEGTFRHVTDVAEIQFPAMPPLQARRIQLGVYDTYESGLTLNYNLFSGFADQASVKISKHQLSISGKLLEKTKKDLAYQVISLYRQSQIQELNIAALNSAKSRVEGQLNKMKSFVDNGMALPIDTLTLALARLTYEQNILSLSSIRINNLDLLKILIGHEVKTTPFNFSDNGLKPAPLQTRNLEVLQTLRIQQQVILSQKRLARSNFYPKVNIQASIKYGKPGLDMIENDWMYYGVIGLGMNWTLWNWGADKAAVKSKEALYRRSQHEYTSMKDQLETRYSSVIRDLRTLDEQIKVAHLALDLAKEKMRIIKTQSEQGVVSATDFNDANLELAQAEMEYKKQLVQRVHKINEIDYISGQPISEWRLK